MRGHRFDRVPFILESTDIEKNRIRKWSGREDLNLCPFRDKCKIFRELQEKKISVHSEFIELLR